jgi:hypothetical protein
MTDIAAPAKPTAPKTITTKHLAYTLAEQHQLTKKHGQQMVEDLVGLIIEHVPSENVIRKSIGTISGSNSLFARTNSLFLRKNSLFRCVGNFAPSPLNHWTNGDLRAAI